MKAYAKAYTKKVYEETRSTERTTQGGEAYKKIYRSKKKMKTCIILFKVLCHPLKKDVNVFFIEC